jgi:outer membrane protein assembly factor BamE (lipoprotein component of BamABCDE complex)
MNTAVRTICAALLLFCLAGWGCASSQGQAAPAEKAAASIAAVPDDSPLAKITIGMDDSEVRKVLGEPTTQKAYTTGKAWIPFYYGPDTSRTDYIYKGIGRVVFSRNQYSGQLKVINVLHNPNEAAN